MIPLSSERARAFFSGVFHTTQIQFVDLKWNRLLALVLTYALLLQLVPRAASAHTSPPVGSSKEAQTIPSRTSSFTPKLIDGGVEGVPNNVLSPMSGNDVSTFPGIVGLNSVTIGASSAYVDSFDSLFGYSDSHGSHANVFSNGQIDLKGAKVYGNVVSSQGNVILENGSLVSGDLTYSTTLTNSGTVQGTISRQTSPSFTAAIPAACGSYRTAPTSSNNWVTGNFTYDQTRGDLTVSGGNVATLANGTFCLHNLTLSGGSTLTVNGAVVINLTGQLNASGGSFANTTNRPSNLQISTSYTGNNGVTLSGGTSAYLKVYAPGTSVTLSGGSPIFGALVGKTLTVSGNSVIHYDTRQPDTTPPRVAIISPVDNSTTTSASLVVSGTGSDNGSNDTGLASITVNGTAASYDPATGTWSLTSIDLVLGSNIITAVATDNTGNQSSTQITVTRQPPPNQAPTVSAGQNQTVILPATASLNGSASDDGLPVGTLATTWSQVSGPGTVSFGDPNVTVTTAAFSMSGTYLLRLTANDSQLSSSSDITVIVIPQNQAPTVNAGADQTITLPNVASLNGSVSDDGLPAGGSVSTQWTTISGPGTVTFANPNAPVSTASFSVSGTYVLRLSASDSQLSTSDDIGINVIPQNHAPTADAGADQSITLPSTASLNGTISDDGLPSGSTLTSTWTKVSGPGTVTFFNPNSAAALASFSTAGNYVLRLTASDSQLTTSDEIAITVIAENHAPAVNAGADQTITLPNAATLNGSVSDDGLPAASTVTTSWTKVSGPGGVIFGTPNNASTTASFSAAGTYVLRLTASDSQLSTSDDLVIVVDPENQAPLVNAGADQSITLPSNAALNGTVTDDGWPRGSSVSIIWSKISGPGTVNFTNPGSATTAASFSAAGTYVLRLTANDSQLSASDDVSVIVIPENHAPTANAGSDQTVTLPNLATLNGTVSDDGLPSGGTLTSLWSKVSGPGTVTFANANNPVTTASFSAAGSYVLRLTASDSQLSSSDDLVITVNSANQAPSVNAGPDQSISINGNLVANPGNEEPLLNGLIAGWTAVQGTTWTQGTASGFPAAHGNSYFFAGSAAQAELRQDIDVSAFSPGIDAGTQQFAFQAYVRSASEAPPDLARVVLEYRDAANNVTGSLDSATTSIDSLLNDEFNDTAINSKWLKIGNETTMVESNGALRVSMPSQSTDKVNMLAQPMPAGDWEIVTKLDNQAAYRNYNSSGLLIAGDLANNPGTAGLMTYQDAHFTGGHSLEISKWNNRFSFAGDLAPIPTLPTSANPLWQKIVKTGTSYTFFYSTDGITYTQVGNAISQSSFGFTPAYVGVYTNNALTGVPIDVSFDFFHLSAAASTDIWHLFEDTRPAPAGTRWIRIRLLATRNSGTTNDAFFDAISLRPVGNAGVKLNGSTSDDGLPSGSNLTSNWSVLSGPGGVVFADANSPSTGASFNIAGTYVLRLTGNDGELSASDDVVITVNPANQAPLVNAGPDQNISACTANLQGSATDDGLPLGSSLTISWSKVSGPGNVTFANPAGLSTSASFSAPGNYVLRLTASDSDLETSDDLAVAVVFAGNNAAPVVNAGPDQTILAPATSATLNGSATDDGLPACATLTVSWTQVSGPSTVSFANANSATTTATFAALGAYVLRLTASDSQLTSTDDVTVIVATNQPPVADFGLASNKGPVPLTTVSFSSYRNDGFETYHPKQLLDTSVNTYWWSANGQVSNQSMVFGTSDGQAALIDRVRLQNVFTDGTAVNQFEVQVSSATANASDFHSVLIATMPNNPTPMEFVFPGGPATARFIKLVIISNYGSSVSTILGTFQPVSFGGFDSIVSFLGKPNSALNQSPALIQNGGAIYDFSYGGGTNTADQMLGYARGGWVTTTTTNEFAIIQLGGNKPSTIDGVKIATWYDSGYGFSTGVKDFEVWTSSTTPDASSFTRVLSATVVFNPQLQTFMFPGGPVQARYVKYVPLNNGGGGAVINTPDFDVIAEGTARVVAASGQYEFATTPPENAFDANVNSYWYSQNGVVNDVWVKTSLEDETVHKVYGVRINPVNDWSGPHGPKDFDIRVSTTTTDDSAFATVYSGTLSGALFSGPQEFLFPSPVNAKYVEFYWKNSYGGSNIGVSELEVLADSAKGSTLIGYSSSNDPISYGPENALDIDTLSPWRTGNSQTTDQWLKLSLPGNDLYTIDHVALMPGSVPCGFSCSDFNVSPKDFEVQVSTTDANDSSFATVFAGTLAKTNLLQHFSFTPVQARYVRLLLKNNYGSSVIALNSFHVYTSDHAGSDPRFIDRSTDSDGHVVAWSWNFGDGGTSNQQSPSHHYAAVGTYTVTLTVSDDAGLTATRQTNLKVGASPDAPSFAFSPVVANEGAEYVRFTDTTNLMMQSFGHRVFDFGNGGSVLDLQQATYYPYQFPDSGTLNVTMTLGDNNSLKAIVTQPMTVRNLPPSVTVETGKTVVWGEPWTNTPQISDPSSVDNQTLQGGWNFGDGQTSSCTNCNNSNAKGTHAYAHPGNYHAVLTITDKDGSSGAAGADYVVNKRPTRIAFQNPPAQTNGQPLIIHAQLIDAFANLPLSGKPIQFRLNGASFSAVTDANGGAEVSVPLPSGTKIDIITGSFAEDEFYLGAGGVGVPPTAGGAPPNGTLGSQGTNFWLMFPQAYSDSQQAVQSLYISSRVDTTGSVTIPGGGFNFTQNFTVQANTITTVRLPSVQVTESDIVQSKGIHVTSQQPVTVYGLNQRVFTSDAFLALPVNTLGTDHFILTYSNNGFVPSSEFGVVATEDNTTLTITPVVTTGPRTGGVAYNVTLNQGQTYQLQNTVPDVTGDLTGSRVAADKPIAVFGAHEAPTIPAEAGCCADHIVEQMTPISVWGKRFATVPIATRTKGDFFRFIASQDGTAVYLNGNLVAMLNRGQWVEKIITDPAEIISTNPIMVAQYATSIFYDPPTTGWADPFEMIIPPYSQFLNHYTVSTPGTGFGINYANVVAATASLGSITLDGNPIPASSFTPIGVSGYSGAQVPITVGMHNFDGPASFGVFIYGFNKDEGYGYPGGMNMSAVAQSVNIAVTPETVDRPINSQLCLVATVTNQDQFPLGGRTVSFTVTGANPGGTSATTDAAGRAQFCYTGTHLGSDLVRAALDSGSGTASVQWLTDVPNQPPVVNAGADQTITQPAPVNLQGSVSDDGLPGYALSVGWSKVSGPGNVTFTNSGSVFTTATFTFAGVYVLRLTASDTSLSASDDVQITVNPTPTNHAPTANAGPDLSAAIKGNLIVNPGNEEPLVNGKIPGWIEEQGSTWTQGNSGIPGLPDPQRGNSFFWVGTGGGYAELRQDIDVSPYAASIAAGTQQFELQAYIRQVIECFTPDIPEVVLEYRNAQNDGIIGSLQSYSGYAPSWALVQGVNTVPIGTGWIRVRLIAQNNCGATNDAYFDSISLRPVGNTAVKLNGAVTDDGLPFGSSVSANWTQVSGPAAVTFTNANAANSAALFTTPGTYVLRLTAGDGQLNATDDVTVTISPVNQGPSVGGSTQQTITLPDTAPLNGIISDDGLPVGSTVSAYWKKDTGPGIVTFANPNAAVTTASFSTPGFYVLMLTADDSEYSASTPFYVTVNPSANNQPPVVNAGPDQTIALPANTVNLNGAAADDGLPSGSPVVVQWTQVSGPALATFANPNTAVTTAQFSTAGTYVFRLNASDGQLTSSDDVTITVTAQNHAPTVNAGADQTTILSAGAQLNGTASDDGLPTGSTLTTTWSKVSGPGTVTFLNVHAIITGAQFSATGTYVLRLTASDGALSVSDDVTIIVSDNVPAPTVQITAPDDGGSVTDPTIVTGSVSGGDWKLEYSLDSTDDQNSRVWTQLAGGNGPTSGTLGTIDPTMMLNGLFDIRLSSTDQYGQTSRTNINVIVERNLKVGNFTVSFTDLSIPVPGVPMEVTRTYDSRDKRVGDFGFGWTLGLNNIRVEKSSVVGLKWFETVSQEVFPNYCLEPVGSHAVTVTFPGGKVFKFQPNVAPHCQRNAPITAGTVSFTPMPGTVGKLEVVGSSDVQIDGSVPGPVNLIGFGGGVDIFNSFVFKFTAEDGTAYIIDQRSGLQSLADPNGNTLTISAGGIVHSSGKSIVFNRDIAGRITSIVDPNGNSMTYGYDPNGDLISYTDNENNTSTYAYDSNHRLLTIHDPRGIQPIRNDYDPSGRLISHTDGFGKVITYIHDIPNRTETVTDRLGHPTVFEYDDRGNVLRKTDARGGVTSFTYDANDNVLTETNALGKTTTYTYDANDHRTSITDPLNNVTQLTYDALGKVLTMTDPLGHVTTNTYNPHGDLLTTEDALHNVTSHIYSVFGGQMISMTDALNHTTHYDYTGGYLTKETDALDHETTFGYDNNGNRTSQTVTRTNAQGQIEAITTNYEYDKLNRVKKTTIADGSFTQIEYNSIGQQSARVDQLGHRTEFTYDDMGRLTKTTYPDGSFEETTYDAEGHRLTSKDRAGHVTTYTYDELGRLTETRFADGTFTQTSYDVASQVLTTTDARGNVMHSFYDDGGRQTKVRNALDQETTFAYDANGNQRSMTDALSHTTGYEYDLTNRRTKTTYADSTFDSIVFDAVGRTLSKTDQAGKTIQFTYDALGRLTKVKDALNQEATYGYNEIGQQILQTDGNNHTTRFEYDQLGRRVKRILPGGQFETYSYDNGGNLSSKTDFNSKSTTFAYDTMGRLLSKTPDPSFGQPIVSFTYNARGQRATMTDASGATLYSYDPRNRLTSKQTPFGTLSYTYNDAGGLLTTRSSNANGVSVDYTYDALNRLATAKDNNILAVNGGVTNYTYDTVGNLQSYQYPNGVTSSYAYNLLNRLTTMTVGTQAFQLASYSYTLGAAGNRTAVTELGGRTVNYTYDDLYRLTNESIANDPHGVNGSVGYSYDAVGNRLNRSSSIAPVPSQNSTYDANDRLTNDQYDNNGNTVASNGNGYAYDSENRLTSFNNGAVTYVYDGDGNRVAKTVGGVTINYLVDTNNPTGYAQVVDELQNGAVVKSFTYGHDLISQRIVGSSLSFYQYDGHGSVRQLTNATGAITDAYDYDAFGNLIYRSGTTPNDYLYGGEQFDANLGFYYLRARYMNPSSGRFWTMDSFAGESTDPISLHKYLYASADPLNRFDPSGRFSIAEEVASLDIGSILNTLAQLSLRGFISGAIIGGADAALRGDDIMEGAIEGGLIGALLGPLGKVKFLGTVLVALGTAGGIAGTVDAIEQGNYQLAAFRAVLALTGAVTMVRPETPNFTVPPGEPPPTGGRLGSESTRAQLRAIAALLKSRGWDIVGGGGLEKEEYLPPLNGGRKGGNYVDLTATKNGQTIRINTVDTLSDGVTPTLREGAAAALIRQKTSDPLILIPKEK